MRTFVNVIFYYRHKMTSYVAFLLNEQLIEMIKCMLTSSIREPFSCRSWNSSRNGKNRIEINRTFHIGFRFDALLVTLNGLSAN